MSTIRATMTRRLLGETSGPLTGIYLVTHRASGKRYVGQSADIYKRWVEHRRGDRACRAFYNAVKKHGPDAFAFEIVELCAREELNDRECFYIWGFDCLSPNGYNLLTGGGQGQIMTAEVRERIAESRTRLYQDPDFHARQAEANRQLAQRPEWRAKRAEVAQRVAQLATEDPEVNARKVEAANRLWADPDFRARTTESIRRNAQDPTWGARTAANNRRRWADPDYKDRLRSKLSEASRRRWADPTIYTLINIKTGERVTASRFALRDQYGIRGSNLGELLRGERKTTRGYRLARPEELEREQP